MVQPAIDEGIKQKKKNSVFLHFFFFYLHRNGDFAFRVVCMRMTAVYQHRDEINNNRKKKKVKRENLSAAGDGSSDGVQQRPRGLCCQICTHHPGHLQLL